MEIHITRDGAKYGPYGLEEARGLLQVGQLLPGDLAWHEGLEGWTTLGELLAASGDAPPPVPADGVAGPLKAKTSKATLVVRIVLVVILVAVGVVVGLDHLARGKYESAYEYLEAEYAKSDSATPAQVVKELGSKPVSSKKDGRQVRELYEWRGPLKIYQIRLVFTVNEAQSTARIDNFDPKVKWRFGGGDEDEDEDEDSDDSPDLDDFEFGPGNKPVFPGGKR